MTQMVAKNDLKIGILAGLVGAVTVEAFLFAVKLASWPGTYQWIASTMVGKAAFASAAFAWLGVAQHVAVSLVWGIIFVLAARRRPGIRRTVVLSGTVFGLIVFAAMQGFLALLHSWTAPTPMQLALYLVDHALFFGVPVAVVTTWFTPGRQTYAQRLT